MSPAPEPRAAQPLFRAEAMAEQESRWLGRVLIVPKVSHTFFTGLAALVMAVMVSLFAFGDYTRKVRMNGWLAPEHGLIPIVAAQPGVVIRMLAAEGIEVEAGETLAVLSGERHGEAVGATEAEAVGAIHAGRNSLRSDRSRHEALLAHEAAVLARRLEAVATEIRDLDRHIELQRQRVRLAETELARQADLRSRGIGVEGQSVDAQSEALDQSLALRMLERERTTLDRMRLELEAERAGLPLRRAAVFAEVDRALAALDRELAEAEAAREVVIAAPDAGTVTTLRAAAGASVGAGAPLMTLVPAGSSLEVRLYGPSRAIGFIRPGQRVLLRYEAYPHQRFGLHEGTVRSVSRSPVPPDEIGARGAALPGLDAGEPLYRVTVGLARQTATAYGEEVPLHPGMPVEADILIETQRLSEWVLDPLHALTGRGRT